VQDFLPRFVAALGILLVPAGCGASEPEWWEAKSPHFTLYTDAGEAVARRLIGQFETAHRYLRPALSWAGTVEKPVRIVAFQSAAEMEPYAPHQLAVGFFLAGDGDDFIVVAAASVNSRTAAHEYCHALLAQNGLRLPPWLNEGLAEVYSGTPEGHVQLLSAAAWSPLADLLGATYNSPLFQDPEILRKSYAECWLLGHMLVFDPRYAPHLGELIRSVGADSGSEVLPRVYGKPLPAIEKDLARYLTSGAARHMSLPIPAEPEPSNPVVRQGAGLKAGLTLAELLSQYRGRHQQARQVYDRLEREYPQEPAVELGIANLCVREGDPAQAAAHRALAEQYAHSQKAER
jgi:hypothetical protein